MDKCIYYTDINKTVPKDCFVLLGSISLWILPHISNGSVLWMPFQTIIKFVKIVDPTCITNHTKVCEQTVQVIKRNRNSSLINTNMMDIEVMADLIEQKYKSYDGVNYKVYNL